MPVDISQVVEASGLPPSTLHHYEDVGLIEPVGRKGLRRQYDEDVVERLAIISLGRDAGFSLDEIQTMLPLGTRPNIDRSKLEAKADELDATIVALQTISSSLRHAAVCKAPSHLECDTFKGLLAAALERRTSAR